MSGEFYLSLVMIKRCSRNILTPGILTPNIFDLFQGHPERAADHPGGRRHKVLPLGRVWPRGQHGLQVVALEDG